jgi:hypothetical protein
MRERNGRLIAHNQAIRVVVGGRGSPKVVRHVPIGTSIHRLLRAVEAPLPPNA